MGMRSLECETACLQAFREKDRGDWLVQSTKLGVMVHLGNPQADVMQAWAVPHMQADT